MDPLEGDKDSNGKPKLPDAGRGKHPWLRQDNNTGLRRPHGVSVNQSTESTCLRNTEQLKSIHISEKKQSMLSADAAEFVPKYTPVSHQTPSSHSVLPQKCSVQDRLRIAREAPPNVHTGQTVMQDQTQDASQYSIQNSGTCNTNSHNSIEESCENYPDSRVLDGEDYNFVIYEELEKIIITLISSPGDFDYLVPRFVSNFRKEGNIRCLPILVTNIVNWSITESNFRYNGARVCACFDSNSEPNKQLLFRDTLYYTCKFETKVQELEWQRPSDENYNQNKCHGLILFLAELVAQMDENFAFSLGGLLIEFITNILKKPSKASNIVKYICQALKLAGQRLEKDKDRNTELENMMRALTDLVTRGQVDIHVGNMVHNVHELRNGNWGRSTSNSDSSKTNPALLSHQVQVSDQPGASNYNSCNIAPSQRTQQTPNELGASNYDSSTTNIVSSTQVSQSSDEQLVYGPDGQLLLSAEEREFLQEQLKLVEDQVEGLFEEPYDDENYDDEIASAYEEFLRDKSK